MLKYFLKYSTVILSKNSRLVCLRFQIKRVSTLEAFRVQSSMTAAAKFC